MRNRPRRHRPPGDLATGIILFLVFLAIGVRW